MKDPLSDLAERARAYFLLIDRSQSISDLAYYTLNTTIFLMRTYIDFEKQRSVVETIWANPMDIEPYFEDSLNGELSVWELPIKRIVEDEKALLEIEKFGSVPALPEELLETAGGVRYVKIFQYYATPQPSFKMYVEGGKNIFIHGVKGYSAPYIVEKEGKSRSYLRISPERVGDIDSFLFGLSAFFTDPEEVRFVYGHREGGPEELKEVVKEMAREEVGKRADYLVKLAKSTQNYLVFGEGVNYVVVSKDKLKKLFEELGIELSFPQSYKVLELYIPVAPSADLEEAVSRGEIKFIGIRDLYT